MYKDRYKGITTAVVPFLLERVMAKRYFEYKDAKSKKFWEVSVSGKKVNIRYGKLGTDGQTSVKELSTPAEAKAHAEKQAAGKVKKGYKEAKVKAVKRVAKKKTVKVWLLYTVEGVWQHLDPVLASAEQIHW